MSVTAARLIANSVQRLGQDAFVVRTATGGSATTFIDTALEDLYTEEDLKYGTIIVLYDSAGASASPEGKWGKITAYDETTNTVTFSPTMTDLIASGDRVLLIMPDYPQEVLLSKASESLKDLGEIYLIDTSLTSSATVTEYTLPTTLDYKTPVAVYLETDTTTQDNQWIPITDYRIEPAAAGSARTIIFSTYLDGGHAIGLVYEAVHPELTAYNSSVSGSVPLPLVELMLASKIREWYGVDDESRNAANKLLNDLDEAKKRYSIWTPEIQPQVLSFGRL